MKLSFLEAKGGHLGGRARESGPRSFPGAPARLKEKAFGLGTEARGGQGMGRIFGALLVAIGIVSAGEYDSALAPYPAVRNGFPEEVESLLSKIEANAPSDGSFSLRLNLQVTTGTPLNWHSYYPGPFTLKSFPNWYEPPRERKYWDKAALVFQGKGRDFRLEKPADDSSPQDWWQKQGEHLFARRTTEEDFVWRFHPDALEADLIAYCEGLCLYLLSFQPGEYIRRAYSLSRGKDVQVNGTTYATLVAKPEWLCKKLFLENRTHFPFNESTMLSWANLRPQVTYLVDPEKGAVARVRFDYFRVVRDNPKDWHSGWVPRGLVIECWVEEWARTAEGTWFPAKTVGQVWRKEELSRQLVITATYEGKPESLEPLELPVTKRCFDVWPPYRPEVFDWFASFDGESHATRVGRACALAFEGKLAEAEEAIKAAIEALENDPNLEGRTFGGIDWELGFALYEFFWRYTPEELEAFWSRVPHTPTWRGVLAKAVHLYTKYRSEEAEKIALLYDRYEKEFEEARRRELRERARQKYIEWLEKAAQRAREEGRLEDAAYLSALKEEVEEKGLEGK